MKGFNQNLKNTKESFPWRTKVIRIVTLDKLIDAFEQFNNCTTKAFIYTSLPREALNS